MPKRKEEDALSEIGDGFHGDRNGTKMRPGLEDMEDLVEIYGHTLMGPYLQCMGGYPDVGDRVLEVKVINRKGVLPTSIISGQPTQLIKEINDPWIREVVCRLVVIQNKQEESMSKYSAKYFIKSQNVCVDDPAKGVQDKTNILLKNDEKEVYLGDRPSTVDETGVRGHPKGLVSKTLINRLDGLMCESQWLGGNSEIKGTRLSLRLVRPVGPACSEEAFKFPPSKLSGMKADCMAALIRRVFYKAKNLDVKLIDSFKVESLTHVEHNVEIENAKSPLDDKHQRSADDVGVLLENLKLQVPMSKENHEEKSNLASDGKCVTGKETSKPIDPLNNNGNGDAKIADGERRKEIVKTTHTSKSVLCSGTEKSSLTKLEENKPSLMSSKKRIRFFFRSLFCCMPVFKPAEADTQ